MSCSNSSELYCSPAQDASLFPDLNYTLSYNPEFEGLNGSSNVDIYLYHADNSALSQHFPNQTNNGNMTYTIDTTWFTASAAAETQVFPYRWYIVGAGELYNLPSSSTTFGPIFWAVGMSLVVKADGETPKATATSTATGTAQTSGGSFSTGIALNSISNKSLAPGAIAGIVIGVIIAFAAFLLALFFFRRKQRNAKHNSLNSDVPRSPPQPSNDGEKTGWTFTDKDIQHAPSAVYEVPLTLAPDTPRTLVNLGYDSSRNTSMESLSRPPKSPRHQLIQSFPLPSDTTPPPTPSVHRFPAEPVPIQPLPIQSIQPAPVVTFTRTNSKRGVDNPFPARKPAPSNEPLPDNRLKDPRNSEESLTKITPTKVSVVQVQGMQRKPSIKTLPSKAPEKRGILVTKSSKDDLTSHDERI